MVDSLLPLRGETFALRPASTDGNGNGQTVYVVMALQAGQMNRVKHFLKSLIALQSKTQILDFEIVLDAVFRSFPSETGRLDAAEGSDLS